MKFLVDECTGPSVARWLQSAGHDVVSISDSARGISDDAVLARAVLETRILITNDKDFGEMVYRERKSHCGVIFLRLNDERPAAKIDALSRLLTNYAARIDDAFVVVSETQVRFAKN